MQNILTQGNGVMMPIKKLSMSVTDVMVIETAASSKVIAILSTTDRWGEVRLHAPSMTNVSSMPIPEGKKNRENFDFAYIDTN